MYDVIILKTLDIRQQWIPRAKKQRKWTLWLPQLPDKRLHRLLFMDGKYRVGVMVCLIWGMGSSVWETKAARICRTDYWGGEIGTESTLKNLKSPLSVQLNNDQCMYVKYYMRLKKETPKGLEVIVPSNHTWLWIVPVPTS
jgi:hypothetical protein